MENQKEKKMKSSSNAVVALLSLIALGFSSVSLAQTGERNNGRDPIRDTPFVTYEIMFDGFCDGVSFNLNTASGIVSGVYNSSCATCEFQNRIGGISGSFMGDDDFVTLSWETGPALYTVIHRDGTWIHYDYTGSIFNYGTWSDCSRGMPAYETNLTSTYAAPIQDFRDKP